MPALAPEWAQRSFKNYATSLAGDVARKLRAPPLPVAHFLPHLQSDPRWKKVTERLLNSWREAPDSVKMMYDSKYSAFFAVHWQGALDPDDFERYPTLDAVWKGGSFEELVNDFYGMFQLEWQGVIPNPDRPAGPEQVQDWRQFVHRVQRLRLRLIHRPQVPTPSTQVLTNRSINCECHCFLRAVYSEP